MARLNDLAARYGISPTDFLATLDSDQAANRTLYLAKGPDRQPAAARFDQMRAALGMAEDVFTLSGSDSDLYTLTDGAVQRAPRLRPGRGTT